MQTCIQILSARLLVASHADCLQQSIMVHEKASPAVKSRKDGGYLLSSGFTTIIADFLSHRLFFFQATCLTLSLSLSYQWFRLQDATNFDSSFLFLHRSGSSGEC